MIKITTYDKEKQHLTFESDMEISLANAIRRSVLEIPVLGIDEVEIVRNDSALYDEILAHRIGLIPLKTDKTSKETKFKLVEEGPKMIYSTDISPSVGTSMRLPIVLLDKGQGIELVCHATLGKGIEHIKYSPGLLFYTHNIDNDILDFVYINPDGTVSYDDEELKNKGLSEEKIKKIKLVKNVKELIVTVEGWGQLEVKEIFTKAINTLEENLKELSKIVK